MHGSKTINNSLKLYTLCEQIFQKCFVRAKRLLSLQRLKFEVNCLIYF